MGLLVDWTHGWGKNLELEDISIETYKTENQREQRLKKKKKNPQNIQGLLGQIQKV